MYLNGTKCVTTIFVSLCTLTALAKNTLPTVGQSVPKPLVFIENNGQYRDMNGKALNDIQFRMSSPGVDMYVGAGELHYQFRQRTAASGDALSMSAYRVDVSLLGANPVAKVEATDRQAYYENYYTAGGEVTAASYGKIRYKEVYPGIDWVIYVNEGKVEYDFVVQPGADASQIRLKYGGATSLALAGDGSLVAETPMGKIQERKLYAYDAATHRQIAARFAVKDNIVSFNTARCEGTLTIDPFVLWSTYFGAANEDVATAIAVSPAGNVYIGGYSSSTTLGYVGAGTTPHDVSFNGNYDAFITKYNAAGVRQFTTYWGGAGNDRGTCLAIDGSGSNIFLGGFTTSNGLASFGAYHTTNLGLSDGFIFKINFNGTRQFATYYGGAGNDYIYGMTIDASNNIYVTGRTESSTSIASGGVFQTALSGSADAFVAKFATSGANIYSSYYGGTGVDEGRGVAVDASGNAIVTGQTNSVINIATAGAHQTTLSGANDAFVGMLNSTATARTWGTYLGGSGTEQGRGAVCNTATGGIGIVGYTSSSTGMATANAHQTVYGGGVQDAFVSWFDASGALSWSTYYGGADIEFGEAIALDPSGNIVVAGGTFSTDGISSPVAYQAALAGNYDAFFAKLTPLGQRIWGSYFGDALYDYAFGVACDASGQIHMAGHTTSTTGIASAGASQTAYGGGVYDAFCTKFTPDTFALISQPYSDTLVCAGGTLRLNYMVNLNFRAGNVFTAQLSDAAGSFASPVNIGAITTGTAGNIICTIPPATTPGTGYRIRITGTSPNYISPDEYYNIRVVSALSSATATANTPLCVTNTLALNATAGWSIDGYSWTGPAGFSAAVASPTVASVTLANAGVYSVSLSHNGCPDKLATVNVVVNDVTPVSPVAFSSALNCNGGALYLYADTGSSISATYSWSGPGGFSSTMQNPVISTVSLSDAGTYYVVDTVDGCPSAPTAVTVTITPNTPASVAITVSPNDTVCGGTTVNFTAHPVNGGISPAYQWMNGTMPVVGAIASSWSTSTLTDGAMISCIMNSNAVCPLPASAVSNTIAMNIITNEPVVSIYAVPGTSVAPGDSVVFMSVVYNAGIGALYQWQRNGTDIPGATNTTYTQHSVTVFDTIRLAVLSTMDCATPSLGVSNSLVVHPNTAVANVNAGIENVSLYPNPAHNTLRAHAEMSALVNTDVKLAVINAVGQVMYSATTTVENGVLHATISTTDFAPGMYMLQLEAEGASTTQRFVVQH